MTSRLEKIKDTYSSLLQERLQQENVEISMDSAWDILVSSDPSHNKKNVRWLVDIYINDGYLWEDIAHGNTSKVAETLVEFDKHKCNLDVKDRSLTRYQTLGSLWSAIKPYVGQMTTNEEKREERDKAYAEAEVIVDRDDGLKVVIPLTRYASQWWGRGTRWCTASDNNNMFNEYAKDAPLLIFLMPNGDKLQFWKNDHQIQFMDENDDTVGEEYIEKHWDILSPLVLWADMWRMIPEEYITTEMVKDRFRKSKVIHDNLPAVDYEEICEWCIEQDPENFICLPMSYKTKERLNKIEQKIGRELKNIPRVPAELIDEGRYMRMINTAMENNENIVEDLSSKYMTKDLVWKILKYNVKLSFLLSMYHNKLFDEEMVRYVYEHGGNIGVGIKPNRDFLKPEYYKAMVSHSPYDIQVIDKEERTDELCWIAIHKASKVFMKLHDEFKTFDNCVKYTKYLSEINEQSYVECLPSWFITDYISDILDIDCQFGLHAPEFWNTDKNLIAKMFHFNSSSFEYIPDEYQTKNMFLKYLSDGHYNNMKKFPDKFRTEDVYRFYLNLEDIYIKDIPTPFLNEETILKALKTDISQIKYISDQLVTENIVDYIISKGEGSLIPDMVAKYKGIDHVKSNLPKTYTQYENEMKNIYEYKPAITISP